MFRELAPLLRKRAILLTITHVGEDQYRVNVIPKKLTESENDALTTPVSITGTAEDLDIQLPSTLLNFVSSHLELKNTLDRARTEMDAAAKAAKAEARNKIKAGTQKKVLNAGDKSVRTETSVPQKPEPPKLVGLFDSSEETLPPLSANVDARVAEEPGVSEEEELFAEIGDEEHSADEYTEEETEGEAA